MKIKLFLAFLSAVAVNSSTAWAQNADTAYIKVYYTFIQTPDTTRKSYQREENMGLYIGKNMSEYLSLDKLKLDSVKKQQIAQLEANPTGGLVIDARGRKPTTSTIIINNDVNNSKNDTYTVGENLLKNYYYSDECPSINWELQNEIKKIGSYTCTKAMGKFRGRTYEVWFTADIPISAGPWKLKGLPGLILEAADSQNYYIFKFAGIENMDKSANNFIINNPPEKYIKTTKKDFTKLQDAARADPVGFVNATSASMGVKMKMLPNNNYVTKKLNNPIELTDE